MTYAAFESKNAPLSGDFGRDYAMRTFNLTLAELEKLVGRYTRGNRKGQLRGRLVWHVVTSGGWVREMGGRGFVVKPGLRYGHAIVDAWSGEHIIGQRQDASNADMIRNAHADQRRAAPQPETVPGTTLTVDEITGLIDSLLMAGAPKDQIGVAVAQAMAQS